MAGKKKGDIALTEEDVEAFMEALQARRKGPIKVFIELFVTLLVWFVVLGGLVLAAGSIARGLMWVFGF